MSSLPIIITFAIYLLLVLLIGYLASRVTSSLADYMLGGRGLNGLIAAFGAGASDMSGWLLLGLPGAVYALGIDQVWLPIGLSIGAYLNWRFIAARLRVYTEIANDSLTIPAYFENRFHDESKILRIVTGIVILIFFTVYASSGFVAGGLLFESIFNMPYFYALTISAGFLVIYTTIGGFLAVNWVDLFQGSLMFIALLVVPLVTILQVGGWLPFVETLTTVDAGYTDIFSHHAGIISIVSLLAWGLGYFGQPHILVRFMAVTSVKEIPKARRICMTWMVCSLFGAIMTGLAGYVYFLDQPLKDSETVFLMLAKSLFSPWMVGILFAAVLSAIMSTIAAQLLASASALSEDFYRRFLRPKANQRELLTVSRITVVLIAAVAFSFALNPNSKVLTIVSYAWAGLGASFGPVVLLSLFWPRMTRNGAVAGIVTGTVVVIVWDILHYSCGGIFNLYEIVPGFFAACLAIVSVSLRGKKPSQKILDEFAKTLRYSP